MGKGGKPKIEVTQYYMSEHLGVCVGPPDALLQVKIKEKQAWVGEATELSAETISQSELFGGIKKEGGAVGTMTWLPGEADQVLHDELAQKLGRADGQDCPGFRGLASLFFTGSNGRGFYWTANAPYLPGVWATVRRILKRSDGSEQWYPEKARILSGYVIVEDSTDIDVSGDQFEQTLGVAGDPIDFDMPGFPGSVPPAGSMVVIVVSSGRYPLDTGSFHAAPEGYEPLTDLYTAESILADAAVRAYYKFMGDTPDTSFTPAEVEDTGARNAYLILVLEDVDPAVFASEVVEESGVGPATYHPADIVIGDDAIEVGDIGGTAGLNHYVFWSMALLSASGAQALPIVVGGQVTGGGASESAGNLVEYREVETDSSSGTRHARSMALWGEPVELVTGDDMNPAHIIRECLTDTMYGMGTPAAALDDDSFTDAADTLYAEGFGLSILWTRQISVQDFIQEVLDHIQAVLFTDPATGLLTLKLIRGDYEAASLPELTPDNCAVMQFSRKLWGEITNEVVVTWTNPENEQEETVTAQDLASIAMQGGVVSDSRNYYGVRNASLAQSLAWRDLRSAGQPLASVEVEADRTFWTQRPGGVVKLTWPEYALSEIVFRIVSIDYGKPGDMTIKMSLVEDVFGLDIGTYEDPPATEWEDPSAAPEPMEFVDIFTLPYMFAVNSTVGDFIDSPDYPEVVAGVLASTSETDTYEYELWDEVTLSNSDLEWQRLASNNVIGRATLAAPLDAEVLSEGVLFSGLVGDTVPTAGGFAIIGDEGEEGNEIAMIDADNGEVYGVDLVRGVLDTIPRAWPAGTPVWFLDESTVFEDPLVRAAAEEVSYKLLSRTSQGLLTLAEADLESHTLTERPWLPSRPANVVAYGEAWSSEAEPIDARLRPDPWISTSWANRNRLTEDSVVLAWDDANVTPETGQTTRIDVCDNLGNVIASHDGLSGTSFDVPDASFGSEDIVELRFYADRTDDDGEFASLQFFSHWVQVGGGVLLLSGDMTDGDDALLLGGDESGRVQISGA
jgi:hypothetical protein